jgi:hypothetical protein
MVDKWGYIDKTGQLVIKPTLPGAGDFKNGLASISTGETNKAGDSFKIIYINKQGKKVLEYFTSTGIAQ